MRALAHSARIAIAQHLALDGPATATECARITGLSASACSYHLRALARWGFIEEDKASAADGRHRPWRARAVRVSLPEGAGQPAAARTATRLLMENVHARFTEPGADFPVRRRRSPPGWQAAPPLDEV